MNIVNYNSSCRMPNLHRMTPFSAPRNNSTSVGIPLGVYALRSLTVAPIDGWSIASDISFESEISVGLEATALLILLVPD